MTETEMTDTEMSMAILEKYGQLSVNQQILIKIEINKALKKQGIETLPIRFPPGPFSLTDQEKAAIMRYLDRRKPNQE